MAGFDAKRVTTNDWIVLGSGAVMLVFSLFSYVGGSVGGFSASVNAWRSGANTFAILLGLAVVVVVALRVFDVFRLPPLPVGQNVLLTGVAGLAAIIVVLRFLTLDTNEFVSRKFGGYLFVLGMIGILVGCVLNLIKSGEKLDLQALQNRSGGGPSAVPPGQGYGQPQGQPQYPPPGPQQYGQPQGQPQYPPPGQQPPPPPQYGVPQGPPPPGQYGQPQGQPQYPPPGQQQGPPSGQAPQTQYGQPQVPPPPPGGYPSAPGQ